MVLEDLAIIVPIADAGLRLPWFFLQRICQSHFKVAGQCSPHGFRNLFQIDDALKNATMRLHIPVVVISHDLRRQVWYSKPDAQVRSPGSAAIEIELRPIVEIQDVRSIAVYHVLYA